MSAANRAPYAIDPDDKASWQMSLSKIMGRPIKDVVVSASREFGEVNLIMEKVVFEDDTWLACEGEHDLPYLTDGYGPANGASLPDIERLRKDEDDR